MVLEINNNNKNINNKLSRVNQMFKSNELHNMCNANNAIHLYLCIYYIHLFFMRMFTDRDHLNALHYFADK